MLINLSMTMATRSTVVGNAIGNHLYKFTATVKTETWTLAQLLSKVDVIKKPHFNRDLAWNITTADIAKRGNTKKRANFEEFLEFLFKTRNSVTAISLGSYIDLNRKIYVAIDGNNRINAVIRFLQAPHYVFGKYYVELFEFIHASIIPEMWKTKMVDAIKNLTYSQLSTFSRLDDVLTDEVLDNIDGQVYRTIERKMIEIQKKLKSPDGQPYDVCVKLIINEFENGTNEEYCAIFRDINKHANTLSQNEFLAAVLCETMVTIVDYPFRCELVSQIVKYNDCTSGLQCPNKRL